ncbi:hypothetical protein CP533_2416 [Ophiocordyceps camponoti-saundersi (nom. inval.)]|nr:hypothetical protein CP533_2416 [Ophiocordyceps camponoti-saundersi (nom. inval.)]
MRAGVGVFLGYKSPRVVMVLRGRESTASATAITRAKTYPDAVLDVAERTGLNRVWPGTSSVFNYHARTSPAVPIMVFFSCDVDRSAAVTQKQGLSLIGALGEKRLWKGARGGRNLELFSPPVLARSRRWLESEWWSRAPPRYYRHAGTPRHLSGAVLAKRAKAKARQGRVDEHCSTPYMTVCPIIGPASCRSAMPKKYSRPVRLTPLGNRAAYVIVVVVRLRPSDLQKRRVGGRNHSSHIC